MIRECNATGCTTLTMGELCLEHESEACERPGAAGQPAGLGEASVPSQDSNGALLAAAG